MSKELNMNSHFKVEYIDPKLYKNKWGSIDHFEAANHYEAMLNEYHAKGYKLLKIMEEAKDTIGQSVPLFIFELRED